jgi:methionyl-tRNA formyltransferase
VIITQAKVLDTKSPSGQIFFDKKNLIVGCKDSNLQILKLKPIGKNEMDAASFIAGYSNKA